MIGLEHWKLLPFPLPKWISMACSLGLFYLPFVRFVIHILFTTSLVLMTYFNMILSLSGYQANEQKLLKELEEVVSR